jgi:hypothetical protein
MDLNLSAQRDGLCSTGYCLLSGRNFCKSAEFSVFTPDGSDIVVKISSIGWMINYERFNTQPRQISPSGRMIAGENCTYPPPYFGDAVLYFNDSDVVPPALEP